jgi:hypothetical protein
LLWTQGPWDPSEAAFAVLNQETGPDITSVYMTVAADLVISQVSLLLFLSAELNQETGPDITSVYMTVAADLVISQVSLLLFLSAEPNQETAPDITSVYMIVAADLVISQVAVLRIRIRGFFDPWIRDG